MEIGVHRIRLGPEYDIFALGVVFCELFSGRRAEPLDGLADAKKFREQHEPLVPDGLPAGVVEILKKCRSNDRKTRPPIAEVASAIEKAAAAEKSRQPDAMKEWQPIPSVPLGMVHAAPDDHAAKQDTKQGEGKGALGKFS